MLNNGVHMNKQIKQTKNNNQQKVKLTMKKFSILFAAVALMAMTACNEKATQGDAQNENAPATKTEQVAKDSTKAVTVAPMEKAEPTDDGKDHTVAQFNTKEYQVTVENLADGTYRVSMAKDGKNEQVYETKNCRIQGDGYLMQTEDGKNILINGKKGQIVILSEKEILYKGQAE
jgi:hypothetical protein